MKILSLTTACAALILGVSSPAFAVDGEGLASAIHQEPVLQQAALTQPGTDGRGPWPSHWAKGEEYAATDALNMLETHGYATFSNFHKSGNDFEATVREGGKSFQVLVDPAKRTVSQES